MKKYFDLEKVTENKALMIFRDDVAAKRFCKKHSLNMNPDAIKQGFDVWNNGYVTFVWRGENTIECLADYYGEITSTIRVCYGLIKWNT